ncbi:MAG: uroporphyrinogen decarboxylase family protein [Myxococcota bacterium]|jgi:hypothetical protein|nr:uroporphyrinogen decarboxylase family protein [Myxococcota bacterium]
MDFKERILTALHHEEPDRVPVMGLIMDPATVKQITGKSATDGGSLVVEDPGVQSKLEALFEISPGWNRTYYGNSALALESAIQLGFDANWSIYAMMMPYENPDPAGAAVMADPYGRLWEMGSNDRGDLSVDYTRGLCPTPAEWEAWVEAKGDLLDQMIESTRAFHIALTGQFGDRIMPMSYAAPGIFENSWQAMGFVEFTKLVYENPSFIKRVVRFQSDLYLRNVEAVMEAGGEVILGGDDLGQKTGPLMRPELIEELYGDCYRAVADLVHASGRKFIFHSCGKIYKFLDRFVDWGFDGIITMEPTAGMELARVREQVGHKLALIGNLDVSHLLVSGTRAEVDAAVKKAIHDAGRGGGYILSAAHSHPFVDAERLEWMLEAAHEYGRYPLQV